MFELPGYQTLDLIDNTADIRLYRLLRQEDGLRVIAKTTIGEYPGAAMVDAFRHEYDMLKRLCGRGAIEPYSLEIMADRPVLLLKDIEGVPLGRSCVCLLIHWVFQRCFESLQLLLIVLCKFIVKK